MTDEINLVGKRRAVLRQRSNALKADIEAKQAELDALLAEDRDLEHVEGVLSRLSQWSGSKPLIEGGNTNGEQKAELAPKTAPPSRARGLPRPNGTPTTADMVQAVIRDAGMGLTSTQIVSQVAKRWWPGVVSNDIMPTVYRHIKKGLTFDKKGDLFVLRESRAVSMFE